MPYANRFYREVGERCLANFTGDFASVRVGVPAALSDGQPAGHRFCDARTIRDGLDPHRIYASPLLDTLFSRSRADRYQNQ